ncbi:PilZ domain-containing protein [Vogesella sp. LIG4]|uniref:PilZ domain-containing protein n=1 Tax=Vogesella sp. LIG4 TaxID=1192162 RepID=UPI00081FDFC6|nr:PilZ domain-containing protein [Vogesella sp. LIG4]SCK17431.1 Predicted glycosyltransferase [Vogesella sp. LIG4]
MTEVSEQAVASVALSPAGDTRPQLLQDAIEIAMLMAELQQQGAAVYLYPPGSEAAVEGTLPAQTAVGNHLQLYPALEAWPLLQANPAGWRMVAMVGDCIVQAELPPLQLLGGQCSCAYPQQLTRWQRRAFLRLDAPLGRRFSAAFTLLGEAYQANIYDLSLGGVGLYASPRDLPELRPGRQIPKASLELGPGRTVVAELEVRLCRSFHSRLLGEQLHVGCRFRTMSEQSAAVLRASLAELAAIQRLD